MSELKPCPFCGGEAEMHYVSDIFSRHRPSYWSQCCNCRMSGKHHRTRQEAIDAWNTRAERTCEFKPFKGPISDTDEEGNRQGVCSVCSAYMHEQFCYCPNCGRKVVDE